jgi:hypothetical protein
MTVAAFPLPNAPEVEAHLATLRKPVRRDWWRDHTARLRAQMADAGVPEAVAAQRVAQHLHEVREAHAARRAVPPINFTEPPPLGTLHRVGRRDLRLIEVRPHIRRDGQETFVLIWDSNGTLFSSGLRSNSLCKVLPDSEGVTDAG